ncbi:hypothetical protein [Inconstantimicrobium porci]|uniref:Uncharacterized protein n=1 Tax=Inconstantimicrobium porci TaxID=2652291 RepID=A0A7X2MZR5_9CLOT|nr:hypothetical protein [Inconstantimicrobium porci]MSR92107.1 hypothetical protein [Inconstantimicrobium porci]
MQIEVDKKVIQDRLKDFQHMSNLVNPYFEKENIHLSFAGYSKTLSSYINCDNYDIYGLHTLLKDLNFWVEYMGEVVAINQYLYLKYENMFKYYSVFDLSPKNQVKYNEIKQTYERLKIYTKLLRIQYNMFKSCSYNVLKLYNESSRALIYRSSF